MTTKLLICPYFGDLPPWMGHWHANAERALLPAGYTILLDHDEDSFRDRVRRVLDIEAPTMWGTGNIWDFRPAFGLLYADELDGFDFWGHTDFDCVYGRVGEWIPDELLADLDLLANHDDYVSGPWSLYRNVDTVNSLFLESPVWRDHMESFKGVGWLETDYTAVVDAAHDACRIRLRYVKWQTRSQENFDELVLGTDGRLLEDGVERMMCHFRRTKVYPAGCIL